MARVFVSHSSRDNTVAAEIKAWLSSQGFDNVFLDIDKHSGIPPGANWERMLYQEIDSSHAVVLILTPNWLDSKWCFVEFAQARALGKAIFPVIVAPGGEHFVAPDIQYLNLLRDRQGGLVRLAQELTEIALNTQGGFAWDIHRPPYPGLLSFEAEDAAVFFGRDDDIRRLIERLNARRVQGSPKLVALLGASGSGKSSLLRAGVLPRLARDKRNWIVLPPVRPRLDPIAEIARAATEKLGHLEEWSNWRERLASEAHDKALEEIAEAFRVKAGARDAQILVTIDQAEEIFTLTPPQQAQQFWQMLKTAAEDSSAFLVLMALRSEYLGMLQTAAEGVVRFEEFSLGPMPFSRVRQIIEGPARVAGLSIEEGLISAAAQDAGGDDALPLLAFTLRELYDRHASPRDGMRQLLLAHYQELGDPFAGLNPLENSVRKRADEVIAAINPSAEELQALRDAFVGPLVRVNDEGEYVRHPSRWSDLPPKALPILQKLIDARLLVTRDVDGQHTVEVTHEALIRKWPRLRAWLDEEREFLIGKSRLEAALADWEKAPEADKQAALLQGLSLSRASQWLIDHPLALSEAEQRFVKASQERAQAERRRRLRSRIALIAAALLVLALTGVVVIGMRFEAARREALQRGVDATRLAYESGRSLRAGDLANAVQTALKAEQTLSTPETRSSLLQSLLALSPHLLTSLTVKDLRPVVVAAVPGADDVLIGGLNGTIESWRPAAPEVSRSVAAFKPEDATPEIKPAVRALVATNAQGALALLSDGRLHRFDPADGRELASPADLAGDIDKAAVGESGGLVVASSQTAAEVSAFSCSTKSVAAPHLLCQATPLASGFADAVAVNEGAGLAAIALEQQGLLLIRLGQSQPKAQKIDVPEDARVNALAFDRSGKHLAVGTMTGETFIFDLKGSRESFPRQAAAITALGFDPAGSRLATSCDGFAICVWKLSPATGEEPQLLVKLVGHQNAVLAVAFGPGNDSLVSIDADEVVKSWTIEAVDHVSFALPAPDHVELTELGVSSDRKWLAAGDIDGGIDLWDTASLAFVRSLPSLRPAEIRSLQWHPDKNWLVQTDKVGWLAIRSLQEDQQPDEIKIDPDGNTVDIARWLPDGRSVAVGLFGGELKEWSPGKEPMAFGGRHPDAVQGLAVDPSTERLYSSDSLGNLWLWDIKARKKLSEFPPVGEAQDVVDLRAGGGTALTAGNGGKVTLYDVEAKRIRQQLDIDAQSEGAGFSPDGKLIAAVDTEGRLHIWTYADGDSRPFATVKVYADELLGQTSQPTYLRRLTWLPEMSAIAIASTRGEVKLVSYDVLAWVQRARSVVLSK
ncbi:MAG: TIR domain-containing protein [Actinomycetota bacterium]